MSELTLLEKIEEYREEIISLSDSHELTSEVIIASSIRLDKLINDYQNLYTMNRFPQKERKIEFKKRH